MWYSYTKKKNNNTLRDSSRFSYDRLTLNNPFCFFFLYFLALSNCPPPRVLDIITRRGHTHIHTLRGCPSESSLLVPPIQVIIIRLSRNHRKYISFIINYYYVYDLLLVTCERERENKRKRESLQKMKKIADGEKKGRKNEKINKNKLFIWVRKARLKTTRRKKKKQENKNKKKYISEGIKQENKWNKNIYWCESDCLRENERGSIIITKQKR